MIGSLTIYEVRDIIKEDHHRLEERLNEFSREVEKKEKMDINVSSLSLKETK